MSFSYPDPADKMETIREALCWASGKKVVFIDDSDGGRVREANEVWGELRLRGIRKIGVDEVRYIDLELGAEGNPLPIVDKPRQDCVVGLRNLNMELRLRSRSQEHRSSAWFAGASTQTRIGTFYARETFFGPKGLSFVRAQDVFNMSRIEVHDGRVEDAAIMEFDMETFFTEVDATMVGTWIEQIEISSKLRDCTGSLLDSSLQLDEEVMP